MMTATILSIALGLAAAGHDAFLVKQIVAIKAAVAHAQETLKRQEREQAELDKWLKPFLENFERKRSQRPPGKK
jgi:hypothetical protein